MIAEADRQNRDFTTGADDTEKWKKFLAAERRAEVQGLN
jgi:hypothetical protein